MTTTRFNQKVRAIFLSSSLSMALSLNFIYQPGDFYHALKQFTSKGKNEAVLRKNHRTWEPLKIAEFSPIKGWFSRKIAIFNFNSPAYQETNADKII